MAYVNHAGVIDILVANPNLCLITAFRLNMLHQPWSFEKPAFLRSASKPDSSKISCFATRPSHLLGSFRLTLTVFLSIPKGSITLRL